MKAVLFFQHGGPEVLEYRDFPTPVPRRGEVLVRLHVAALNRVDLTVRQGWPGLKLELPHINGADGAGEIIELGEGVADQAVGQHVAINPNIGCGHCEFCSAGRDNLCRDWNLLGETMRGTYAEYIRLPARQLYPLPPEFELRTAAASALVFQTAWHSLITRGNLRAGETVVIVGAGGGVNTASVRVAKFSGARVIVVGSDARKLEMAESLGADVLIDRSKEGDWSKAVYAATHRAGADVVVDNVGITFPLSLRALRKGGRLLTVGNSGGPKFEIDNRFVFGKQLSIIGSTMSPRQDFVTVMDLVVAGKLQPALDQSFPLREAAAAQKRLEDGLQFGKITLDIG
ncbi:MAG TPA: zinc-binding dehydrogenase [Anaerolineales bacterium]|nr:zinc-binding dehydrogenase [Anaerolineales bacterium]